MRETSVDHQDGVLQVSAPLGQGGFNMRWMTDDKPPIGGSWATLPQTFDWMV